ncbi:hypothetical protein E1A91_D05G223900v1 [Gossypium mustelinum]|uniref:Cytochrome b5 heme-binding domain-containing protein n=3 Tax=Gossypium TaxID=3633 RepID=A0A5J5RGH1_GOSBA|nr:hypothetical protein ES319_D05G219300v1 [Gossypium barbadense]PPD73198.1 hypothetical protein GOBAR_DD29875 [Gossypium barbadense]TYG69437.1 hypothetical protein ES288_D05G230400v1 [Gossypium darwinii]TYI82485.1 hypothetical protein E1A91_D05G223900v1 [Gossypium mustelinum]
MMQLKISDCSLDDIVRSIELQCSVRKAQLPTLYLHSSAREHPPLFSPSFAQIKDCWLVIDGRALNVTRCLEEHPGGEEVLIESAGKDTTQAFSDIGRSKLGYSFKKDADAQVASIEEPKKKEMSAFVIKDDSMPKYASIVEMFLPLLVAGSYFSYRYLTTASSMV